MDNKNILVYCIIKDEQWYSDEVSDTTLMTIAASLLGQQKNINYPSASFLPPFLS
jgi:hypothetical protein